MGTKREIDECCLGQQKLLKGGETKMNFSQITFRSQMNDFIKLPRVFNFF